MTDKSEKGIDQTAVLEARLAEVEARLAVLEALIVQLPEQIVERLTEARNSVEATLHNASVPMEFLKICQTVEGRRTLRERTPQVDGYIFMSATLHNKEVRISNSYIEHLLLAQKDGLIWVLPAISSMRTLGHLFLILGGAEVNPESRMDSLISLPVGRIDGTGQFVLLKKGICTQSPPPPRQRR